MLINNKKIDEHYCYMINYNSVTIGFDIVNDSTIPDIKCNFITKPLQNIKDDIVVYITEPVFYQIYNSKDIDNYYNYRIIRYNQTVIVNNINIKAISSNTHIGWCNYIINSKIYYISSLSTINRLTLYYEYNNYKDKGSKYNNNYYIINYKADNTDDKEILNTFTNKLLNNKEYSIVTLEHNIFFYELLIHLLFIINKGSLDRKNKEIIIISDEYYSITDKILSTAEYFRINVNYKSIRDIKVYRNIEDITLEDQIIFINNNNKDKERDYKDNTTIKDNINNNINTTIKDNIINNKDNTTIKEYNNTIKDNIINNNNTIKDNINNNIIKSIELECNIEKIRSMFNNVIYPYEDDSDIYIEIYDSYIIVDNYIEYGIVDKDINKYIIKRGKYNIKDLFDREYYILNNKYYFIEDNLEVEVKEGKFYINEL